MVRVHTGIVLIVIHERPLAVSVTKDQKHSRDKLNIFY